jgi:hypothetical protein
MAKDFYSKLFLYCVTWMYAALVLFALVCLVYFKDTLVVNQILDYYGVVMLAGALLGGIQYLLKGRSKKD